MKRISGKRLLVMLLAIVLIAAGGVRVQALDSSLRKTSGSREYMSVQLRDGDTLWSIAQDYCGSDSTQVIRAYVNDLKEMNHIENDRTLKPGAYVMIYTVSES